MATFQKMRENMISGQFLPGLVKNKKLLEVFNEIDREKYLPNNTKHMAYSDVHIKLENQRYSISPFTLAKIIETANILAKDVVMIIAAGTGYESAIISKIAGAVVATEESSTLFNQAEENLKNNFAENIININCSHFLGLKKHAPYDKIIILGSVIKPPKEIISQLAKNGKLLSCENYDDNLEESKLFIYNKVGNKIFREYVCDLNLPKLDLNTKENDIFNFER